VNPAIIAGSKNERLNIALEEFWLELAENVVDLAPWHSATSYNGSDSYYSQYYQQTEHVAQTHADLLQLCRVRQQHHVAPRWMPEFAMKDPQHFRRTQGPTFTIILPLNRRLKNMSSMAS